MKNFDNFDRKSFRKEKFSSKNKDKKYLPENHDEQRFANLNRKQIKRKLQEIEEEERWDDWEDQYK
jgi:hypothetical protein